MLFVSFNGLGGPTPSRSSSPIDPEVRLTHRYSLDGHCGDGTCRSPSTRSRGAWGMLIRGRRPCTVVTLFGGRMRMGCRVEADQPDPTVCLPLLLALHLPATLGTSLRCCRGEGRQLDVAAGRVHTRVGVRWHFERSSCHTSASPQPRHGSRPPLADGMDQQSHDLH